MENRNFENFENKKNKNVTNFHDIYNTNKANETHKKIHFFKYWEIRRNIKIKLMKGIRKYSSSNIRRIGGT